MGTRQRKKIKRSREDHDRSESMVAEFIGGGPFDGMRLRLEIVREGPNAIRVLEMAYDRRDQEPTEAAPALQEH